MKKILTFTIFLSIVHLALCQSEFTVDGIKYMINGTNTVKVKSGTYSGDINVPMVVNQSSGNNYTVTEIGDSAFFKCTNLTNISMPLTITSIGKNAFRDCSSLLAINIPTSVTSLGDYAFRGCTGIINVNLPSSLNSTGNYIFMFCSGLKSVTIPESITIIGDDAFYSCTALSNVVFPNLLTSIGNSAFMFCKSLTNLSFPGSLTTINDQAFLECIGLTSLFIPSSINSIGRAAFQGCSNIKNIVVQPSNPKLLKTATIFYCSNLIEIEGPATIFYSTFGATSLESIKITSDTLLLSNINNINYFFRSLKILDMKEIANTNLPLEMLNNCYSLENLILPKNISNIPYRFASDCISLKTLSIPSAVENIEMRAFENCRSLKKLSFESNSQLKSIGNWAFYSCHSLDSIFIPEGVTSIGDGAFWSCDYLKTVELPSTVTSLGDYAFEGCKLINSIVVNASTPPLVLSNTFNQVLKNIPVKVPVGSLELYKTANGWKDFVALTESTDIIKLSDDNFYTYVKNGKLIVSGLSNFQKISIYDSLGKLIMTQKYIDPSEILLPHKGVYIVKVDNITCKVVY